MKYYHLTDVENLESIKKEGLKCNEDGQIFVLTTNCKDMVDCVAFDQIFAIDYILIEIDGKGVMGKVEKDEVAEYSKGFQRIIHQDVIEPCHLKFGKPVHLTRQDSFIHTKSWFERWGLKMDDNITVHHDNGEIRNVKIKDWLLNR